MHYHCFEGSQFKNTKFDSAADKAAFGNHFLRFVANDFKESLFTERFYRRLSMTFDHIAHYNRNGFFATWFSSTQTKVEFLQHTLSAQCWGQAEHTYSDVEKAIQHELRNSSILERYQVQLRGEIEQRERALLSALKAKYEPAATEAKATGHLSPSPAPENQCQLSLLPQTRTQVPDNLSYYPGSGPRP
jgi:hypothetical protein